MMGGDKKLEVMSEEIKLLKGELKQSLASVRDYLLNMELPTSEFSNILDALDNGEGQKVTMTGTLAAPEDKKTTGESQQEVEEVEPEISPEDNLIDVEGPTADEALSPAESTITSAEEFEPEEPLLTGEEPASDSELESPEEPEETPATEPALTTEENMPMDYEKAPIEASFGTPKVNMLANLIAWVAKAKKEIGQDRLPTLLEVYGISGNLSSELKEVIIQLADIAAAKPDNVSEAGVWSEAMLSLHGILTGGDAPLHPILPFLTDAGDEMTDTEEETIEEEKPKEPPFKLKLVFPDGDGQEKEFCINLTPEAEENNGSKKQRKK
jgi:hypothetical protein